MSHQQQYGQQRRRQDFLGYYKALGINLDEAGEWSWKHSSAKHLEDRLKCDGVVHSAITLLFRQAWLLQVHACLRAMHAVWTGDNRAKVLHVLLTANTQTHTPHPITSLPSPSIPPGYMHQQP